jgi:hypothetical protein
MFLCSASFARIFAGEEVSGALFYIKQIDFEITGRTKWQALQKAGSFKIGEEISDLESLNAYIKNKTQTLLNNRGLSEAAIEYTIGEAENGGRQAVYLRVFTVDTRNFIVLPEPKFSSNGGFEPAVKIRDYNFLGTMTPLKVDIGYTLDEFHLNDSSKGKYSLQAETSYPFQAFGLFWNFNFAIGLSYVAGEALSFNNITGLSLDIPVKQTTLSFGFDQGTVIQEEYYLFEKDHHAEIFEDIQYMYSKLYGRWKIPLGITIPGSGELVFTPEIAGKINYRLGGADLSWRNGPILIFDNKIGFEKINWLGNFREGTSVQLGNKEEYNVHFDEWNNSIELGAIAHKKLSSFAGISGRIRYKQWFNPAGHYHDKDRDEAANMLRGIVDRSIFANYMLSLNLDFPFHVFTAMPSVWFNNSNFSYFDFELFLSPILDMAFVNGTLLDTHGKTLEDLSFSPSDFLVSGGFEMIVFPLSWRSVFMRFSVALNIKELCETGAFPSGNNREIYIGIGHQY